VLSRKIKHFGNEFGLCCNMIQSY